MDIPAKNRPTPDRIEGDSNLSPRRRAWSEQRHDSHTRALLDADSEHFLHQSLSSPCLDVVAKAEGIWIEDLAGRRYMDFHGNSAHHIGYGHPRLIAALKDQLDDRFLLGIETNNPPTPWMILMSLTTKHSSRMIETNALSFSS